MLFSTLINSATLFAATGLAGYVLEDDYFVNGFFDQFSFWDASNGGDPTHGFVAYQSQADASSMGLINSTSNSVRMGVDSNNNTPNGRPSVRLTSNKSYSSGLVIVDIEHMPGGICGTWPAFWMVGPNWPNGGEIDIIEGVNNQQSNDMTLHTGPGCSISNQGGFAGNLVSTTCESANGNNQGCQIASSDTSTYGSRFNAANGGVYAMDWTSSHIDIYFFPRNSIPSDINAGQPNPSNWGTPQAHFVGDCDFTSSFVSQQIVFDTTFCGDWAGGDSWSSSGCAASTGQTCSAYVQNNPQAFADAYWTVKGLKVYQDNGNAVQPSSTYVPAPAATSQSVAAPAPTTFIVATSSATPWAPVVGPSGTVGSAPASPAETGTGYAPIIGGDGGVDRPGEAIAPAAQTSTPQEQGEWSVGPGGVLQYNGEKRDVEMEVERRERHARHLRMHHKRHGSGRF